MRGHCFGSVPAFFLPIGKPIHLFRAKGVWQIIFKLNLTSSW